MAPDALWRGIHPFGELIGPDALAARFWTPLRRSLTRMQRRQDIFFAGRNEVDGFIGTWVVSMGHLMGTSKHAVHCLHSPLVNRFTISSNKQCDALEPDSFSLVYERNIRPGKACNGQAVYTTMAYGTILANQRDRGEEFQAFVSIYRLIEHRSQDTRGWHFATVAGGASNAPYSHSIVPGGFEVTS